ncbi:STAS domain-containing protein [Actinoplanes sp. NPDC023714]|uniref:STAS domain-containing protein n=1 Tax=Actinoplanes sp. NPDC023714 TaxID=3154322 RepID=UPI0033FC79FA
MRHYPHRRLDIAVTEPDPGGPVLVMLAGELDGEEVAPLQDVIAGVVHRCGTTPVQVDAAGLTFLDSSGIRALLRCRRVCHQAGSRFAMPAVSENVFQVLEITGLLDILEVGTVARQVRVPPVV